MDPLEDRLTPPRCPRCGLRAQPSIRHPGAWVCIQDDCGRVYLDPVPDGEPAYIHPKEK